MIYKISFFPFFLLRLTLPVSLNCSFLLAPSVLSNVYLNVFVLDIFNAYGVYIILEIVTSTVIFLTELRCWRKSWPKKANYIISRGHNYKSSTVVITILCIITKYPYLKCKWIFYVDFFYPLSVPGLTVYMSDMMCII